MSVSTVKRTIVFAACHGCAFVASTRSASAIHAAMADHVTACHPLVVNADR